MKKKDLGKEIHDLVTLKKDQMTATMAKALTIKSKHPSNASVSLDPSGENSSGALEEVVPLKTGEIEVPPILRSSDGILHSSIHGGQAAV